MYVLHDKPKQEQDTYRNAPEVPKQNHEHPRSWNPCHRHKLLKLPAPHFFYKYVWQGKVFKSSFNF